MRLHLKLSGYRWCVYIELKTYTFKDIQGECLKLSRISVSHTQYVAYQFEDSISRSRRCGIRGIVSCSASELAHR